LSTRFFDKYQGKQGERGGTFVQVEEASQTAASSLAKPAKLAALTYKFTLFSAPYYEQQPEISR
jgi:hypothetical protein